MGALQDQLKELLKYHRVDPNLVDYLEDKGFHILSIYKEEYSLNVTFRSGIPLLDSKEWLVEKFRLDNKFNEIFSLNYKVNNKEDKFLLELKWIRKTWGVY